MNSAATALARRGSTTRPSGGQQASSAHSRLHQRLPSMRRTSRTLDARHRPRGRRTRATRSGSAGAPTRSTRTSSSARRGHGVMPQRRQPGGVVGGDRRQVEPLGQHDAAVPEPHGDGALAGGGSPAGRERRPRARRGCAGRGRSRVGWRCHGGTLPAPERPAGTARAGSVDGATGARGACGRAVSAKIDSRSSTDDSRSAGCRRCWPLVTM